MEASWTTRQTASGAFDTGQIVQKFIFGIYGTKNAKTGRQLTAATFDPNAKNLLGCATSRTGSDKHTPEEWEEFTEENVLEYLAGEVSEERRQG